MTLKTKVKVGNITNLSDARYCAGMGVEMLGFPVKMDEAGQINLDSIRELTSWVSVPGFILELVSPSQLLKLEDIYSIFTFQLPVSAVKTKLPEHAKIIVTLLDSEWHLHKAELLRNANSIEYILLIPTESFNTIKTVIAEITARFQVLLSITHIDEVDDAITFPISGIALNGTDEIKPGLKDYDHLSGILEKLEVE